MILNLTQHIATEDQIKEGVMEPDEKTKEKIKKLLTFEKLPDQNTMTKRAEDLASICLKNNASHVLIGGAPFFMSTLEHTLIGFDITPSYAFSLRRSIEETKDGQVLKKSVFQHIGFVTPS